MPTKKKSVTEPVSDNVPNSELIRDAISEDVPAKGDTSSDQIVQEKLISRDDRILELQLILEGINYRKSAAIQQAAKQIDQIQKAVTEVTANCDKLLQIFAQELTALQGTVTDAKEG